MSESLTGEESRPSALTQRPLRRIKLVEVPTSHPNKILVDPLLEQETLAAQPTQIVPAAQSELNKADPARTEKIPSIK